MNDIQYICLCATTILNKRQHFSKPANSQRNYKRSKNRDFYVPLAFISPSFGFFLSLLCLKIALLMGWPLYASWVWIDSTWILWDATTEMFKQTLKHKHSERWTRDVGNKCVRIQKNTDTGRSACMAHKSVSLVPRYMSPDCRLCTETDFSLSLEQWDGDTVCRVGSQTHNRDVSNLLCFLGK